MSVYIHHTELSCALGMNLQSCLSNLLAGQKKYITHRIDHLEDAVSFPYHTLDCSKIDEHHHLRIHQIITSQIDSILDKHPLSAQERKKTAIFVGSSSHSIDASERIYAKELSNKPETALPLPIIGYNKLAENYSLKYELSPHNYTISTACSSSANALIFAQKMIITEQIDHAIVIGFDLFNEITALGFLGLDLISPDAQINPFDVRRNGMILGEGCASLFISRENKAKSIALLGGATNTDPSSLTAAKEDGSTIAAVMSQALERANTSIEEVRAIKVHGTATLSNDEAESNGILSTFACPPPIFALKPYLGHTLGASGAVETVITHALMENNIILGNKGIGDDINEFGITLNQSNLASPDGAYLLNFFAFGGNNTSLVLRK